MPVPETTSRRSRGRDAHLAQLASRTRDLRLRGERLLRVPADVNALHVLALDVTHLAIQAEAIGDASAITLGAFAEAVRSLLAADAQARDEASSLAVERLAEIGGVAGLDAAEEAPATGDRQLFGYGAAEENGFPLLVRPPPQYWRHASNAPATAAVRAPEPVVMAPEPGKPAAAALPPSPLPSPSPPPAAEPRQPPTPPPMPVIEPDAAADALDALPPPAADTDGTRSACHLGDGGATATEIDLGLRAAGYDLQTIRSLDSLKDALTRQPPHLVVLGSEHLGAIEEIGTLVQAARARVGRRVVLVAMSAQADLAARLRAMRAGCDAFLVEPVSAETVLGRIRELDDAATREPYRIMIVEDDRSQALFAESILRKSGMQTLTIGEASQVLEKIDGFRPDLVLMDLHMPVCDGMELTAMIREREAFLSTPIVFLSGESDTEKHFEALDAGGDDFLSKPIAPKHLIAAVTSRVRRARQLEKRRVVPVEREAPGGVHDIVALTRRLTGMLSLEDAKTRSGGLLFLEIEDAQRLHGRLDHKAFEALLGKLTIVLAASLGPGDMLARCGDSGYLLLNPDRNAAALETLAISIRTQVGQEAFDDGGNLVRLGLVVGVCPFTVGAGDAKAMIDAAERAMLEARAHEKHGVCLARPADARPAGQDLLDAMRAALETSAFRVVFQPIVSLQGEVDEQFQALLRLPLADGRVSAASELIPAAEQSGLIVDVDRWMLDRCLAIIGERYRDGRVLRIFVSQSVSSARDPDRVEWLRKALEIHQVPPGHVSIELRAADIPQALSDVVEFALGVKRLGVGLTLAGVEAGAQASDMLRMLPVDFLKLSVRYAQALDDTLREELRELVRVAHADGRRVIAPRVEEARVAASLWSTGVDLIQGNFVQEAGRDMSYDFNASAL
ncbi:EAL domain-containing protein [Dokdonella sp. MW10]|uniref:GGDEF/EAL domain-containing response regulator n=1 Tax=Dokdonella sp. MW10 TaxID=2992926 RepID=UPI003F81E1AF